MTRDEITRMAREACDPDKVDAWHNGFWTLTRDELGRFTALVAAAERRKHQAQIELWKGEAATAEKWRAMALGRDPAAPGMSVQAIQREAAAFEREACAKVAEEWLGPTRDRELHIASAIRARGTT